MTELSDTNSSIKGDAPCGECGGVITVPLAGPYMTDGRGGAWWLVAPDVTCPNCGANCEVLHTNAAPPGTPQVERVKKIESTCYACPSQWEGTTESGKSIFVHYRNGLLRVEIGGICALSKKIGRMFDGLIDLADVYAAAEGVLLPPAEVQP